MNNYILVGSPSKHPVKSIFKGGSGIFGCNMFLGFQFNQNRIEGGVLKSFAHF